MESSHSQQPPSKINPILTRQSRNKVAPNIESTLLTTNLPNKTEEFATATDKVPSEKTQYNWLKSSISK